jgi:hypothetical protein
VGLHTKWGSSPLETKATFPKTLNIHHWRLLSRNLYRTNFRKLGSNAVQVFPTFTLSSDFTDWILEMSLIRNPVANHIQTVLIEVS